LVGSHDLTISVEHNPSGGKYFLNPLGIIGGIQRISFVDQLNVKKSCDEDAGRTKEQEEVEASSLHRFPLGFMSVAARYISKVVVPADTIVRQT
jgi:hypothetical protein